jgi:hypothetical protein
VNEDETDGDSDSGEEERITSQGRESSRVKSNRMLFIAKEVTRKVILNNAKSDEVLRLLVPSSAP